MTFDEMKASQTGDLVSVTGRMGGLVSRESFAVYIGEGLTQQEVAVRWQDLTFVSRAPITVGRAVELRGTSKVHDPKDGIVHAVSDGVACIKWANRPGLELRTLDELRPSIPS